MAGIETVLRLDITVKGSAMEKKDMKQLTELTREQLDTVSGGASGLRRIPPRLALASAGVMLSWRSTNSR